MVSKKGFTKFKNKWYIFFILSILIIDLAMYGSIQFMFPQSTFEDKLKVLGVLVQFTSIAIAAIAIAYQVQAIKEKEIQFKIHEQRKEVYVGILQIMEKINELSQKKEPDIVGKIEKPWRELRPKMIIYASPKVIASYKAMERASIESKGDSNAAFKRMAELYGQIRSEIGFAAEDEDVPTRLLMSLFITDIHDSKYDDLFDKEGYLKGLSSTTRG